MEISNSSERIQEALLDGASALRYRADRLAGIDPRDEYMQECIDKFRGHSAILEELAAVILEEQATTAK